MNLEVEKILKAIRPKVNSADGSDGAVLDTGNECRAKVPVTENLVGRARDVRATRNGRSKGSTHGTEETSDT